MKKVIIVFICCVALLLSGCGDLLGGLLSELGESGSTGNPGQSENAGESGSSGGSGGSTGTGEAGNSGGTTSPGGTGSSGGTTNPGESGSSASGTRPGEYSKGVITETSWYSEFFDLSFVAPAGYSMASIEEVDEMTTQFGGGYAVFEMIVRSREVSYFIIVGSEETNLSEEKFLEQEKEIFITGGYTMNENFTSWEIAGRRFSAIGGFDEDGYGRGQFIRKTGNRMLVIILDFTLETEGKAIDLLDSFQPYIGS